MDEMNTFGKTGIGNEQVYNQGFSLCLYLKERFGDDVFKSISAEISRPFQYSFDSAIKKVTGMKYSDIYNDWIQELSIKYKQEIISIENSHTILQDEGTANLHPVWSPQGKKFAFLSKRSFSFLTVKILESSDNRKFFPLPFTEILILVESGIIKGLIFILCGAIGFKTHDIVFGLNIGPPLLREYPVEPVDVEIIKPSAQ